MSDEPCAAERQLVDRLRQKYERRMAKLNVDQVQAGDQTEAEDELEPIDQLQERLAAAQRRLRDCEEAAGERLAEG